MARFTDNEGRDWIVRVDVGTVKRVRAALDIDLADLTGETAERLSEDAVALVDTLYLVCRDQAVERKLSDEDFGRGLIGDPIDDAVAALLEAIADFFPARKRALLQKVLAKTGRARAKAMEMSSAKLDDPELDRKIEAAMARELDRAMEEVWMRLNSPTSSPELSESTPTQRH